VGSPSPALESAVQDQGGAAASQTQAAPAQTASPEPASPAPAAAPAKEPQNSPAQRSPGPAKAPAKQKRHKKTANPDCTDSPAPPAANGGAAAVKPCPPPIVVIKNGGSPEPIVELKGNTSTEQASQQRFTTEQLTTATEANLKKIEGRQLNPSQQEMVSQIKQFMEQAKSAVAAGDLGRGHNLAIKARLLSDELVKP
jgi:hypothetical protein